MKKSVSLASLFICLAVLFSGCGYKDENVESKTTKLDKDETKILTVAETMPSCVAVEDGYCFYAYDENGDLYRVLWKDTEQIAEKDIVTVTYKEFTEYTYEEYTTGWTPSYMIKATDVKININYTIELTVHKSEPEYSSVSEDCFYAYDEGEDYRVFWEDTTGLTDNDRVRVTYKRIDKIIYDIPAPQEGVDPGPGWCYTTKEIHAVKVEKVR